MTQIAKQCKGQASAWSKPPVLLRGDQHGRGGGRILPFPLWTWQTVHALFFRGFLFLTVLATALLSPIASAPDTKTGLQREDVQPVDQLSPSQG